MGSAMQTLPIGAATTREVDILGVFRYANTYATAISLMKSGRLPGIERLVTHRRTLDAADEAFVLAKSGRGPREEGPKGEGEALVVPEVVVKVVIDGGVVG